jgi:dTDP-4-dehydrorhamnose 3,5-epimerase
MIFHATNVRGVLELEVEHKVDERGFFARTWCAEEFRKHGLNPNLMQCSISFNTRKGTLRGMHFQLPPFAESKLVRCTRGAVYDVVVDLRPKSSTFKQWTSVVLSADQRNMVYVPEGCAHGFLTLADCVEVFYQISEVYCPDCAAGVRWDDPAFRIKWPEAIAVISERDRNYPNFEQQQ